MALTRRAADEEVHLRVFIVKNEAPLLEFSLRRRRSERAVENNIHAVGDGVGAVEIRQVNPEGDGVEVDRAQNLDIATGLPRGDRDAERQAATAGEQVD